MAFVLKKTVVPAVFRSKFQLRKEEDGVLTFKIIVMITNLCIANYQKGKKKKEIK